jgi:hypothetical protein
VRQGFVSLVLSGVVAVALAGCGGDDPPKESAVIAFNLSRITGASCPIFNFEYPPGANDTIGGSIEGTERLEDGGGNVINCRVRESMGAFDINLNLQTPMVAYFQATGRVTKSANQTALDNTVQVILQSDQAGELLQPSPVVPTPCTANVDTVQNGAIWIRSLRCDNLRDENSPNVQCLGSGGLLFENCKG